MEKMIDVSNIKFGKKIRSDLKSQIKEQYLINEIDSLDKKQDVDSKLKCFYKQEELKAFRFFKAGPIVLTKHESDKIIDENILSLKAILTLLEKKLEELFKLSESKEITELDRLNYLLQIEETKANISSKNEFIHQYNKRKGIYNLDS